MLLHAEQEQRIAAADVAVRLALMSALPIFVDQNGAGRAWTGILDLAQGEKLSGYDATYLELAVRRGVTLATKDRALAAAAGRVGVAVRPSVGVA